MPHQSQIKQVDLDLASVFNKGAPVKGPSIAMVSTEDLRLHFVLSYEKRPLDLSTADTQFEIYTTKGKTLIKQPYAPAGNVWEYEKPEAGRVAWRIERDDVGFSSITTLHPEELAWRITGRFRAGARAIGAYGKFVFTRRSLIDDSGDEDPFPGGDYPSNLEMELQLKNQYPHFFTEFIWAPAPTETLTRKNLWIDNSMTAKLFQIDFTWGPTDLLEEKLITRISDGKQLKLTYTWDSNDFIEFISRSES